jgi:hypothetical protein
LVQALKKAIFIWYQQNLCTHRAIRMCPQPLFSPPVNSFLHQYGLWMEIDKMCASKCCRFWPRILDWLQLSVLYTLPIVIVPNTLLVIIDRPLLLLDSYSILLIFLIHIWCFYHMTKNSAKYIVNCLVFNDLLGLFLSCKKEKESLLYALSSFLTSLKINGPRAHFGLSSISFSHFSSHFSAT